MEYVYASLLLHYAKQPITEEGLRRILEAAGIEVDEVKVKAVVAALRGVNIDEAIKSASFAVAAPIVAQPTQPAGQAATTPAAESAEVKESRKEEEEKKELEEEVAEGLAALFG
ncbi:MAG: 50S ribosomal protein P1 [Thermofilaceae archaeon]